MKTTRPGIAPGLSFLRVFSVWASTLNGSAAIHLRLGSSVSSGKDLFAVDDKLQSKSGPGAYADRRAILGGMCLRNRMVTPLEGIFVPSSFRHRKDRGHLQCP